MKKTEIPFENIFEGKLKEQITVFNKFSENMEKKSQMEKTSYPSDPRDPLYCLAWSCMFLCHHVLSSIDLFVPV